MPTNGPDVNSDPRAQRPDSSGAASRPDNANEKVTNRAYVHPQARRRPADRHVIDATDVVLGRLASQVAILLRGKHKPNFAPHVDGGDFVIIINADMVALSGNESETKMAYRHSGYPGGLAATPSASSWTPSRSAPSRRPCAA